MSISCIITFQILSKGKWDKFLDEQSSRLKTLGHGGEDYQKRMLELSKKEEERMRDNGYKYLSIANPTHGDEFFSLLFNKDWNDKSMIGITRDKIYCLCSAEITCERLASFPKACAQTSVGDLLVLTNFVFGLRHKELLHTMMLTRVKDSKGGHFADYKKLRAYMRQETYWQGMFEEATIMIAKVEVEGPELPKTFEAFFKLSRKAHVSQAYSHVFDAQKVHQILVLYLRFFMRANSLYAGMY